MSFKCMILEFGRKLENLTGTQQTLREHANLFGNKWCVPIFAKCIFMEMVKVVVLFSKSFSRVQLQCSRLVSTKVKAVTFLTVWDEIIGGTILSIR